MVVPFIEILVKNGLMEMEGRHYITTPKGRETLEYFMKIEERTPDQEIIGF